MSKLKAKLTSREEEVLYKFVERVRRILGKNLASICLYGSKARGDSRGDSDIDVLVALHRLSPEVKNRIIDIAFDLNLDYGIYISPRVIPYRVFFARIWRITPFIKNIKKEGISL